MSENTLNQGKILIDSSLTNDTFGEFEIYDSYVSNRQTNHYIAYF